MRKNLVFVIVVLSSFFVGCGVNSNTDNLTVQKSTPDLTTTPSVPTQIEPTRTMEVYENHDTEILSTAEPQDDDQPICEKSISNYVQYDILFEVDSQTDDGIVSDLYLWDSEIKQAIRLTENPEDEEYPTWSPDGALLAYIAEVNEKKELFFIDLSNNSIKQLTSGKNLIDFPIWSSDGLEIYFLSEEEEKTNLFSIDIDGSNLKQLTFDQNILKFYLTKDDGEIIFDSKIDENTKQVFVLNIETGEASQILKDIQYPIGWQISPDDVNILFESDSALYSAEITDNQITQLFSSTDIWDYFWIDDNSILFSNSYQLYSVNKDGTELRIIGTKGRQQMNFEISPVDNQVLYISGYMPRYEIFLLDINSDRTKQLTDDGYPHVGGTWSPDGSAVLYWNPSYDGGGETQFFLMSADGKTKEKIFTFKPKDFLVYNQKAYWRPSNAAIEEREPFESCEIIETPALTPTPLFPAKEDDAFYQMVNKENCVFPCFQGIVPGVSTKNDYFDIISNFDGGFELADYEEIFGSEGVLGLSVIDRDGGESWPPNELEWIIYLEDEVIQYQSIDVFYIKSVPESQIDLPISVFDSYYLSNLSEIIGEPSRVYISANHGYYNSTGLKMIGIWDDVGVIVEYGDRSVYEDENGLMTICFSSSDKDYLEVKLYNPEEMNAEKILDPSNDYEGEYFNEMISRGEFLPLEQITDFSISEFIDFISTDEDACIETPIDSWIDLWLTKFKW